MIARGILMKELVNPIQQVLAAERAAEAEIDAARGAAELAVTAARKQIPALLHRNESRTQRAVERYEKEQVTQLKSETRALRAQAEAKLAAEQALLEENFDAIVAQLFADVWPQDKSS